MPWQEVSTVSLRQEFVMLARAEGANVRAAHPVWGGRKIRAVLLARGHSTLPSPSTMTAILQRHGQIAPEAAPRHTAWQRFEQDAPNRLWQMDFKGHFALLAGRCHPLTVLDDHSRFAVGLQACGDETGRLKRTSFRISAFRRAEKLSRFKNNSSKDTNVSRESRSLTRKPFRVRERVKGLKRTYCIVTSRWRVAKSLFIKTDFARGGTAKKPRRTSAARTAPHQMSGFLKR